MSVFSILKMLKLIFLFLRAQKARSTFSENIK